MVMLAESFTRRSIPHEPIIEEEQALQTRTLPAIAAKSALAAPSLPLVPAVLRGLPPRSLMLLLLVLLPEGLHLVGVRPLLLPPLPIGLLALPGPLWLGPLLLPATPTLQPKGLLLLLLAWQRRGALLLLLAWQRQRRGALPIRWG